MSNPESDFWLALRRMVPDLPEHGVTAVDITIRPSQPVVIRVTKYVLDVHGQPVKGKSGGLRRESQRFKLAPYPLKTPQEAK